MRLARGPKVPVTVAEWDATPGLHAWIEGEIKRREEVARGGQRACGAWEYDSFVHEIRDKCNGGTTATVYEDGAGRFIELNDPDDALRRCAADRKILAAHPYFEAPNGVRPNRKPCPTFACETCHVDDGYVRGGGNCDTILALAEAYGLEPADETDVEVIRG